MALSSSLPWSLSLSRHHTGVGPGKNPKIQQGWEERIPITTYFYWNVFLICVCIFGFRRDGSAGVRRVGSIFRLRGHQKCKPQIESRSRNLITKWKYKIKDILKLTYPPPNPLLKRSVCITLCLGHIFCKNLTRYGLWVIVEAGLYNMKRDFYQDGPYARLGYWTLISDP